MDKPPIFIIGCPRSGTTLTRVILDSHPNICCGPETHLFKNIKIFKEKIFNYWKMLMPYGVDEVSFNSQLKEVFSIFPNNYMKIKNKKRWAEKTPDNIFLVDFIDDLYPNCQFINIIRDGRDVVSSYKKRWGRITIFKAIKAWNKSMDLTCSFHSKFDSSRYLEIRYEDLVLHPVEQTKKIMDFLGEKWTSSLVEHHKSKHDFWYNLDKVSDEDVKKENKEILGSPNKPIFDSSIGIWKKKLNIFEKVLVNIALKNNLIKFGYK